MQSSSYLDDSSELAIAIYYYEQGIGGTLQLTFLQIGLDWMQLHAGVSFPILEKTSLSLPHLEPGWFPATSTFLSSIDGSIHIPTILLPRLLHLDGWPSLQRLQAQCRQKDKYMSPVPSGGELRRNPRPNRSLIAFEKVNILT